MPPRTRARPGAPQSPRRRSPRHHADALDVLAAVLRYRPVPAGATSAAWLERPMRPLGNDEWAAAFDIDRQCSYEYTVHAWVDRFASWRHGLAAKVDARQD